MLNLFKTKNWNLSIRYVFSPLSNLFNQSSIKHIITVKHAKWKGSEYFQSPSVHHAVLRECPINSRVNKYSLSLWLFFLWELTAARKKKKTRALTACLSGHVGSRSRYAHILRHCAIHFKVRILTGAFCSSHTRTSLDSEYGPVAAGCEVEPEVRSVCVGKESQKARCSIWESKACVPVFQESSSDSLTRMKDWLQGNVSSD